MQYTWQILNMERLPSDGFVVVVYYSADATDGEYFANQSGAINYTRQTENFIPYEELTPSIVMEWVYESLDKDQVEANLAQKVAEKIYPVQVRGLPWA